MSVKTRLIKLESLQPNENTRPLTLAEFRNLAGHTDSVQHGKEPFKIGYVPTFSEFKAELYKAIDAG